MSSIISWNLRGAGGPRKQRFLDSMLRATRANIAFFSETKRSYKKSKKILHLLPLQNNTLVPARGRSGGLWLLWDNKTNLTIVSQHRFLIHAKVLEPSGYGWSLLCVYGDPSHGGNERLWNEINIILNTAASTCVIGDFNAITSEQEKYGGAKLMNSNNRAFRRFIFEAGLVDLGYHGPAYTWTNKQCTSKAIYERLDRAVASATWVRDHSFAFVNHLPRIHSDHCPILLRTTNRPYSGKHFKI